MKQLILLLCMGLLLISTIATAAEKKKVKKANVMQHGNPVTAADRVQQVKAMQQGNRMVLEYTLVGDKPATVSFSVIANGKKYIADSLHLEGDYGKNVAPGRRQLVWNVLQDFPRGLQGKVDWILTAGGGGGTDPTIGMEFVSVPGGCFQMGDTFGDGYEAEKPVHQVCVSDFNIGKYEVTKGQFRKFVESSGYRTEAETGDGCYVWNGSQWNKNAAYNWKNTGFSQDDSHPVACVSFNDSVAFTRWLSGASSRSYRLPTEAEWEYAARSGGKSEKYSGGNDVDAVAWYSGNSGSETHPVGQKQPNGLGIYDMSGNVWEWCSDWYGATYYSSSPKDNPQGASSGTYRLLRGGTWGRTPETVRASSRFRDYPDARFDYYGFRLVLPSVQ